MNWEQKIINAFIERYFASASGAEEGSRTLRLRSSQFFPDFETAHPNEKESYLEATESLERKGFVKLRWEKWGKGERLRTISCENFEMLFAIAGKLFPKTEAEQVRAMLSVKAASLRQTLTDTSLETSLTKIASNDGEQVISFLEYFSRHFGPREIGQGIVLQTMEEYVRFLEFSLNPASLEHITTRALSILLYGDSKHLENIVALCHPLLTRWQKDSDSNSLMIPERSYPETMVAGKFIIEFKNAQSSIVNADGFIHGFPLESAEEIAAIKLISGNSKKTVLTIENKETFYALASPLKHNVSEKNSRYDCFLYTGGYPNRATAAIIKTLATSGFSFYHAGDLDPDGILILQHVQNIAGKPVTPLRMDTATFDQYRKWGRKLTKPMLRQIEKISPDTKAIPGLADLVQRIEETGMGVEQEIIDYR